MKFRLSLIENNHAGLDGKPGKPTWAAILDSVERVGGVPCRSICLDEREAVAGPDPAALARRDAADFVEVWNAGAAAKDKDGMEIVT